MPVVVDVSRSGRFYPIDFRSPVPFSALHDNVSMYVDEVWKDAPAHGATMLQALFPNTYIDANRHELDIDSAEPAMACGFVQLLVFERSDGRDALQRYLEVQLAKRGCDRFRPAAR